MRVIQHALRSVGKSVVPLPAKDDSLKKYSVAVDNEIELIHVTRDSSREYVMCQSHICQHLLGKKKSMKTLNKSTNACAHLMMFKCYISDNALPSFANSEDEDDDIDFVTNDIIAEEINGEELGQFGLSDEKVN